MTDASIGSTQRFLEWVEQNGFADMLRMAADACRVETELDCIEGRETTRRRERLTALAEHLEDVAREEGQS